MLMARVRRYLGKTEKGRPRRGMPIVMRGSEDQLWDALCSHVWRGIRRRAMCADGVDACRYLRRRVASWVTMILPVASSRWVDQHGFSACRALKGPRSRLGLNRKRLDGTYLLVAAAMSDALTDQRPLYQVFPARHAASVKLEDITHTA